MSHSKSIIPYIVFKVKNRNYLFCASKACKINILFPKSQKTDRKTRVQRKGAAANEKKRFSVETEPYKLYHPKRVHNICRGRVPSRPKNFFLLQPLFRAISPKALPLPLFRAHGTPPCQPEFWEDCHGIHIPSEEHILQYIFHSVPLWTPSPLLLAQNRF